MLQAPATADRRACAATHEISVRRRPAKGVAFREDRGAFRRLGIRTRRESSRPPRGFWTVLPFTPPSPFGPLRALLQGTAPLMSTPRCLALTSQATVGDSVGDA